MGEGWGEEGRRPNQRTSLGPGPACEATSGGRATAPMAFLPEVCDPRGLPSPHRPISGLTELQAASRSPSPGMGQDGVLRGLGDPSRTPRPGGLCGDLGPPQQQATGPRGGKGSVLFPRVSAPRD